MKKCCKTFFVQRGQPSMSSFNLHTTHWYQTEKNGVTRDNFVFLRINAIYFVILPDSGAATQDCKTTVRIIKDKVLYIFDFDWIELFLVLSSPADY